jgi:hypothetical protein
MGRTEVSTASILIASDSTVDAALVKSLLDDEFERIAISVDTDAATQDFQLCRPDVLLLAFKDLEKAEQFYLGLFRLGVHRQTARHRAIILCTQQQTHYVVAAYSTTTWCSGPGRTMSPGCPCRFIVLSKSWLG